MREERELVRRGRRVVRRDLIVIGASAGGVSALTEVMKGLRSELAAAVLVVTHFPPGSQSFLPHILDRAGPLRAEHAIDAQRIESGRVYVAPPGSHLVLRAERIELVRGATLNGERPAIDALFRSAAREYGRRTVGVILSGLLDDGVAGLAAIKHRGGVAVVQDPTDADYPDMPRAAINAGLADHTLRAAAIGACLHELVDAPASENPEEDTGSGRLAYEVAADRMEPHAIKGEDPPGQPSTFTCPACGGALWQSEEGESLQFRCHVGHAYSPLSLETLHSQRVERALWVSLRELAESVRLSRRLCERMESRGALATAARYRRRAEEAAETLSILRELVLRPAAPFVESARPEKQTHEP